MAGILGLGTIGDPKEVDEKLSSTFDIIAELVGKNCWSLGHSEFLRLFRDAQMIAFMIQPWSPALTHKMKGFQQGSLCFRMSKG